jgi:hypothetical protein
LPFGEPEHGRGEGDGGGEIPRLPQCRRRFEGPLDEDRHRGYIGGWKAAGLPWLQAASVAQERTLKADGTSTIYFFESTD